MQYAILGYTLVETWGGFTISIHNGKANTQTGRLGYRTLLHKRYMIMRTIGQGGMAAVYQAKDLKHNTLCAIKEMSLSSVPPQEQAQAIQNFLAEATILSRLNHLNLPAFTDFFSEGARHFLVMEYIEGTTLEDLLERNGGPFSERRVLGWARQLCDVLEYLHSQQPLVIFRDMKPGNIMLRRDGRIKLIDFGIARIFRRRGAHDTQMLGTPGFAPPEQYGTSQTDERSDIYSLAMTLFQLMTNTLPEQGFGLQDVRSVDPAISPSVARALEKATDPEPENRYDSIAVFRRALLGVGTFVFERGNPATTPEELAELCARYPEEAADYLFAGEIESWLHEIGASDLARATKRIRVTTGDPELGVEKFLEVVMGANAQTRSYLAGQSRAGTALGMRSAGSRISRVGGLRTPPAPTVIVQPDLLDFGQVLPGISTPMLLHISGYRGTSVRGKISASEPWILLDRTSFDGMSTLVRVRVDSTYLEVAGGQSGPISTHYKGSIVVRPAGEASEYIVSVELDVFSSNMIAGNEQTGTSRLPGIPVEEDEDEDDTLVASNMAVASRRNTSAGLSSQNAKYNKYKTKYRKSASSNGVLSGGWSPVQVSPQQHVWLKCGLTFMAAFMAASFSYMFLAHLPLLASASLLPPNQWFIAVLLGMVPLATVGALLVNRDSTWSRHDIINRFCTGLGLALGVLGLGELVWHVLVYIDLPVLQLCIMLLLTATGATMGTTPAVSEVMIERGTWAMQHMRLLIIAAAVLIGGTLGFVLTSGIAFGCLTPLGVLLGIGVAVALVMRLDRLLKHS